MTLTIAERETVGIASWQYVSILIVSTRIKPTKTPIGLQLANTSKAVSRAFNDRLAEAGGSVPVWLILSSLRSNERRTQLDLARAVGIEGPTLTRHLDGLEENGIVQRVRDGSDRRAVRVELTAEGERLFQTLRQAVIAFNRDLTAGLTETELERVRKTLARLEQNVPRS